MLIKRAVLNEIVAGRITLAFRRWKRRTVKPGGRLRTAVGELEILTVDVITERAITNEHARLAGYASRQELLAALPEKQGTELHRIELRYQGPDGRALLRDAKDLTAEEIEALRERLRRMDQRSTQGPWTTRFLQLIAEQPGTRAQDLADGLGWEKAPFKRNVRKLKELGLTESLEVGYRLSPRGSELLSKLPRQ